MSGVVLRCPTCGTTQSDLGECDTCLEGEVRYFCGNHAPGRWLDEPVCNECGAKFGEAPRRHPEPTPRAATTVPARKRRRSARPPIPGDAAPPRTDLGRPTPRAADPEDSPGTPSLADLLAHMSAERERARYTVEEVPRPEPTAEASRGSLPVMGCIIRLVLFALLFIALALGGLFLLMSGFIQGFMVELGQSTGLTTGTPERWDCVQLSTATRFAFGARRLADADRYLDQVTPQFAEDSLLTRDGNASLWAGQNRDGLRKTASP